MGWGGVGRGGWGGRVCGGGCEGGLRAERRNDGLGTQREADAGGTPAPGAPCAHATPGVLNTLLGNGGLPYLASQARVVLVFGLGLAHSCVQ